MWVTNRNNRKTTFAINNRSARYVVDSTHVAIVDYIGLHCGMHYYDEVFQVLLNRIPNVEVEILSNYKINDRGRFFSNFYNKPKIVGALFLLLGYVKLLWLVLCRRNTVFILYSFGNSIDIGMILIMSLARHVVVDIHETIAQKNEDKRIWRRLFGYLYRNRVKIAIVHSARTNYILDELGYRGRRFFVPHLHYGVSKQYNVAQLGRDLVDVFEPYKITILFFGNIMYNKGIDLLVSAVGALSDEVASRVRVVIAGKAVDDTLGKSEVCRPECFKMIIRHINDDELSFLYSKTDYVILPYRKTSQSGILEMAVHFRRPIIVTDLPYFKDVIDRYPSFGVISGAKVDSLSEAIAECVAIHGQREYFKQEDVSIYDNEVEMEIFRDEFGTYLKS